MRLAELIPEGLKKNLAAVSLSLGFAVGGLLFIGSEIYTAGVHENLKDASNSDQEVETDGILNQNCKDDPLCIVVSGIETVSRAERFTQKAQQSQTTAETMRISAKGAAACGVGFGILAAASRRRVRRKEAATFRKGYAAYLEREAREKADTETQQSTVPCQKPELLTTDILREQVDVLTVDTCASIAAMAAEQRSAVAKIRINAERDQLKIQLDTESARQRQIRNAELEKRVTTIRQEHAVIRGEMELGRQATLAGFASLRAELGLPPAAGQIPLEQYLPQQIAPGQLVPAMA